MSLELDATAKPARPSPALTPLELDAAAETFEGAPPEEVLRWAALRFPERVALATAFGPEGCVLVDAIASESLAIDVFTLDTGLLFPETLELWETLEVRYGIAIRASRPALSVGEQSARYGSSLWTREPDRCCEMRKVEPLRAE